MLHPSTGVRGSSGGPPPPLPPSSACLAPLALVKLLCWALRLCDWEQERKKVWGDFLTTVIHRAAGANASMHTDMHAHTQANTLCMHTGTQLFFKKCFCLCWTAGGTLDPRPSIEPTPLAVEAWSLNQWTTRKSLAQTIKERHRGAGRSLLRVIWWDIGHWGVA